MPTEPGTVPTFPYVKHASRPEGDLRGTTLLSFVTVPFGLICLYFAWDNYAAASEPGGYFKTGTLMAYAALGLALLLTPTRAIVDLGFIDVLPNRVALRGGATVVRREFFSVDAAIALVVMLLFGIMGYANTFMDSVFSMKHAGLAGVIVGPGALALCAVFLSWSVWLLFRRIRMTPEHLQYTRGLNTVTIPWDQIGDVVTANDIRNHEPRRKHANRYLPGAKIAIPEHIVESTSLPVWRDGGTPRLLLEAEGFRVEASSLLTVILAMRDHPELRAELGTKASRRFFFRPPFRVRREMYRTQVWWPAGRAPEGVAVGEDGVVREHG